MWIYCTATNEIPCFLYYNKITCFMDGALPNLLSANHYFQFNISLMRNILLIFVNTILMLALIKKM